MIDTTGKQRGEEQSKQASQQISSEEIVAYQIVAENLYRAKNEFNTVVLTIPPRETMIE